MKEKETILVGKKKEVRENKGRKENLLLRVFVKVKQEDLLVSLNRRKNELLVTLMNEDEKEEKTWL